MFQKILISPCKISGRQPHPSYHGSQFAQKIHGAVNLLFRHDRNLSHCFQVRLFIKPADRRLTSKIIHIGGSNRNCPV